MLLARRQRGGMKVSSADVTAIIKLMLDFVRLQGEAWTTMFGSTELVDTDPIMYWCSYITNHLLVYRTKQRTNGSYLKSA